MPLLRKSGIAIGREFSRGATGLLNDLENDVDLKTAFKSRGSEVLNNLKRKATDVMDGSGLKKPKIAKSRQSSSSSPKKQSKKPTKKKQKSKKSAEPKKKKKKSKTQKNDYFS